MFQGSSTPQLWANPLFGNALRSYEENGKARISDMPYLTSVNLFVSWRFPKGWMSACGPLLLEGGVWGGREEQCSTYLFYMLRPFLFRYHPSPLLPGGGDYAGCKPFERAKRLEPLRSSFERSFAALNSALRAVTHSASYSNPARLGSRGHPSSRRNLLSAD